MYVVKVEGSSAYTVTSDSAQTDYDTSVESATHCLQNGISFVVCIRTQSKLWVFYNSRGEENYILRVSPNPISDTTYDTKI